MRTQKTLPLKERVFSFMTKHAGTSFVELERAFGEEFKGDYWFGIADKNIWFWYGMSEEFIDALKTLMDEDLIKLEPCHLLVYVMDGCVPQIPLAKQNRIYVKPRWLPSAFSVKHKILTKNIHR